ncbi:MAG: FAD/NAD(P)-binding protein, partial [Nanoarchaeota archaeon]
MKIVLGGGIAGLIFAFYNKNFTVISPDVGGQMGNGFSLGPRYLHDIPESRKFLNDLNIEIKEITVNVGYKIG